MKFVLNRDKILASVMGHTIAFKKGEPTHVPRECANEALAIGAIPEEEIVDNERPSYPTDPEVRKAAIFEVFEKIILTNNPDDFTAGNAPRTQSVSRMLGWDVTSSERDLVWEAFRKAQQEG